RKGLPMVGVWIGTERAAPRGQTQCRIEVVICLLQHEYRQRRGSSVTCLHLIQRGNRRCIVAREEARLELSDPVVIFHGDNGLGCRSLLKEAFRELTIIERAELRCSSA